MTRNEMLAQWLNGSGELDYRIARTKSGAYLHVTCGTSGPSFCGVRPARHIPAHELSASAKLCDKCFPAHVRAAFEANVG